jgi:3-dehydroquinate synthase
VQVERVPALTIQSGDGAYSVHYVDTLDLLVERLISVPHGLVIVDELVDRLYREQLAPLRNAFPYYTAVASEDEKTLDGVARLVTFLQAHDANRQTQLIAVGGGIMQDIATFTSRVYYRGISLLLVPTTLLAMADSCIGAKSAINFGAYKNQLGVFRSPSQVFVCRRFLDSLADEELRSGYGEILKLAITGSISEYETVETVVRADGLRNDHLPGLIDMALRVKKSIIEVDEYESGLRKTLNYGHTFGHALEAITDHAVPHGSAVAWGLDLANFIAYQRGTLSREWFERIHAFVLETFEFGYPEGVTAAALIDASRRDKKNVDGKLTMILLRKPGELQIQSVPFDNELERKVARFLELT